ncbi:MAG: hypothetical protein ACR2QS_15690 [Woeseiaceae bacterium]
MIDKFRSVSQSIQILRLPVMGLGFVCLAMTMFIVLSTDTNFGEEFLIPSVVGMLWAMSTYAFIVTFRSVPEKPDNSLGLFGKLGRNVHRGWYWVISVVFVVTTIAAIYFTNSVISVWLRD